MADEQRLSDGAIEDRDRASGTPAPAPVVAIEEAREALWSLFPEGWNAAQSAAVDDLEDAIRAESESALRAATARAERLETTARAFVEEVQYWEIQGDALGDVSQTIDELRAVLSATEEGQG